MHPFLQSPARPPSHDEIFSKFMATRRKAPHLQALLRRMEDYVASDLMRYDDRRVQANRLIDGIERGKITSVDQVGDVIKDHGFGTLAAFGA